MRSRPLLTGVLAAVLLALLVAAGLGYRDSALAARGQLPVAFEHSDHATTPCADCHHNFIDDTGGGACYYCHKMEPAINRQIEDMFHTFCRDCHLQTREDGEDAGPLRACSQCHTDTQGTGF